MLFSVAMDYPEACLFTQVPSGKECPVCVATQENFDDLSRSFEFRDPCSMSTTNEVMGCDQNYMEIDSCKIGLIDMKVRVRSILEINMTVQHS